MTANETGSVGTTTEAAVKSRYAGAARAREACLCAPVNYDRRYLEAIPQEVIEKDYGCGDPSKWMAEGETVLDLGSGSGKICFIASQIVGPRGRVIGVDFNEPMLALAKKYQGEVARKVGHENVTFCRGRIQDLKLDLDRLEAWLAEHPVRSAEDYLAMAHAIDRLRGDEPMIASDSVDCIVSNCVLNLVKTEEKGQLFHEMYRVLRPGGRCVISDIVSDEDIPQKLQDDPELWSGCVSGAFREDLFLEAFEEARFGGIEIVERQDDPWQTIEGIEFRSITVRAYKCEQGPEVDRRQAVIYKGPWKTVTDDEGRVYWRGERMAVSERVYEALRRPPYADEVAGVPPLHPVSAEDARPFQHPNGARRATRETKGKDYTLTHLNKGAACCDPGDAESTGNSGCC